MYGDADLAADGVTPVPRVLIRYGGATKAGDEEWVVGVGPMVWGSAMVVGLGVS